MGEYVTKKKEMVFKNVESLQQVINVINEAVAASNDKKRGLFTIFLQKFQNYSHSFSFLFYFTLYNKKEFVQKAGKNFSLALFSTKEYNAAVKNKKAPCKPARCRLPV